MIAKKRWITLLILFIAAVLVRLFSADTMLVEKYYSTGLYPFISAILKYIFGWLPFSFGDVLYGLLALFILARLFHLFRAIYQKRINLNNLKLFCFNVATQLLVVYIVFNVLWGINYNRQGVAVQLGLTMEQYSTQELITVDSVLLQKVNESRAAIVRNRYVFKQPAITFEEAGLAYAQLLPQYPFLHYKPASIKSSMWGWAGNYLGFMGYYNPFTGEAQLNTTVPKFLHPFTACHEIAHQFGYAKENEANFVGYLAAAASTDTVFHYSVYLDLFLYAQRNLYDADSTAAKAFAGKLLPEAKADLKEWKDFTKSHKSPIEPMSKWLYGKYLQQNQQPTGMLSYDAVTAFVVSYYKKFGKI